jgi:hypothetical protein
MNLNNDELKDDFDIIIQNWTRSSNENTTYLAHLLVKYLERKLNGESKQSETCAGCKHYPRQHKRVCHECDDFDNFEAS